MAFGKAADFCQNGDPQSEIPRKVPQDCQNHPNFRSYRYFSRYLTKWLTPSKP
jgi:hypothetical protein